MTRAKLNREALLAAMAGHVLAHGLNTASLRPLAKAAGTSDRMLIYHFGSKDKLVAELLQFLAAGLAERLTTALPHEKAPTLEACVSEIMALVRTPDFAGYFRVWHDIVASAAQGQPVHRAAGNAILDGFLAWLESRLPDDQPDRRRTAAALLTFIEGTVVMDAVGSGAVADDGLAWLFDRPNR